MLEQQHSAQDLILRAAQGAALLNHCLVLQCVRLSQAFWQQIAAPYLQSLMLDVHDRKAKAATFGSRLLHLTLTLN